ncbi:hypothetical protein N7517_010138 [Penicillium concentricum]|uniref:Uncharacterized protein n=1 Tax=Penicillium concentricum TaxID=293559 RepID=A0A9W9RIY8_9EURO|nr:uncharacterized protein N7517_010138 [Penicillium concentricum]KAJ5360947.1 hypothetical protein N7517_010138 [Penicillium concentricum]
MPPVLVPGAAAVTAETRRRTKQPHETLADANAKSLSQKDLPVFHGQTCYKGPETNSNPPRATIGLANPASVARPESVEMNKRQKTWKPPIHEISDGVCGSVVS